MLRPAPTCLSLSPQDVSFHLQQIDMYHGLLKQGFKKKDVIRYLEDHQEANAPPTTTSDSSETEIECAPSTVDLTLRASPPEQDSSSPHCTEPDKTSVSTTGTRAKEMHITELSSPLDGTLPAARRHAPRQSSLLRFAKPVSPESSAQSGVTETADPFPGLPARTYRPRTDTCSYVESEFSETDLTAGVGRLRIGSSIEDPRPGSAISRQSSLSPMRADAEIFVPRAVQQRGGSSSSCTSTHVPPSILSMRRSSLTTAIRENETTPSDTQFPSSPPSPSLEGQEDSFSALPELPTTPNPSHLSLRSALTEPRRHTPQYLDGSYAFTVYNDTLPPQTQPETPADLTRHQIITEYEAAYTAPVGAIHTPFRSRQPEPESEAGEQSPTQRMMGLRERRARELMRSVRAEGLRLERMRRLDHHRLNRNRTDRPLSIARAMDRNDEARHLDGEAELEGPGPTVIEEQWRDDLEVDRVGDENWEGEAGDVGSRGGIRVLSGNANGARGREW